MRDFHLWEPDREPEHPERSPAQRIGATIAGLFVIGSLILVGAFLVSGIRFFWRPAG